MVILQPIRPEKHNLISNPSSYEFFRIGFKERVLTSIEGSPRLGDDVGEKGLDTWDF